MPRRSKTNLPTKQQLVESLPAYLARKRATKLDVARLYHVSLRTVDSWMAQKRIPYIKLGKIVRFNLDQVEKAIDRHTIREVS